MKIGIFLLVGLITCAYSTISYSDGTAAWTRALGGLNLRQDPALDSKIIAVLPFNTNVQILREEKEIMLISGKVGVWTNVKSSAGTGWVFGYYLTGTDFGISHDDQFFKRAYFLYLALKEKRSILPFIDKEGFVYKFHSDNRCEGITTGQTNLDNPGAVNKTFRLRVFLDGEGWLEECKQKPTMYEKEINIQEDIYQWLSDQDTLQFDKEQKTFYVYSQGSMGVIFYYALVDGEYIVTKIEHRDEDPG